MGYNNNINTSHNKNQFGQQQNQYGQPYTSTNNFDYYRNNNNGNNFVGSMDINENINSNNFNGYNKGYQIKDNIALKIKEIDNNKD